MAIYCFWHKSTGSLKAVKRVGKRIRKHFRAFGKKLARAFHRSSWESVEGVDERHYHHHRHHLNGDAHSVGRGGFGARLENAFRSAGSVLRGMAHIFGGSSPSTPWSSASSEEMEYDVSTHHRYRRAATPIGGAVAANKGVAGTGAKEGSSRELIALLSKKAPCFCKPESCHEWITVVEKTNGE